MNSNLIGDGQPQIAGDVPVGSGYGDKPSLPQHLRNFSPLDGPARAGTILPGSSTPIDQLTANLLNKHYGLIPTGPLPSNEAEIGPFLAAVAELGYTGVFNSWLRGTTAPAYLMRALMMSDSHTLGIGLFDIASAFGAPGAGNSTLIHTLSVWAREHPGVKAVLDGVVLQMRNEGRIPANKEPAP